MKTNARSKYMITEFVIYGRPASKKNSKQLIHAKGRVMFIPSKAYTSFERDALYQLLMVKKLIPEPIRTPVHMDVLIWQKGRLWQDYDNVLNSIGDVLQKAGIIANDKLLTSGSWKVEGNHDDWRTKVCLEW